MMAGELARYGVACRMIDKRSGPGTRSRAIAVQARTLEIFDQLGIVQELIGRGVKYHGASQFVGEKRLVHVSLDELESPFPFVLGVPQTDTEDVLRRHAAGLGVSTEWDTELTSLRPDADGVSLTLNRADGATEELRVRWLIGCDGAHSTVRKALNLTFEGETYEQSFALADVFIDWQLPHDEVLAFLSPAGLAAAFPLPGDGHYRLIWETEAARKVEAGEEVSHGQVPSSERPDPTLDDVGRLLAERVGFPAKARDPIWMANFRVNSRMVSSYRSGRVFLCGDAAHIHSPAGGQGMNTGLQDAFNLGWKLALAERGRGTELLLDSFSSERHRVGTDLLKNTDRLSKLVMLRHPVAVTIRNAAMSFLSSLEVVQQRFRRTIAELSIAYRDSPAVAEYHGGLLQSVLPHGPESPGVLAWRDFAAGPRGGERALDEELYFPKENRTGRLYELLRNPKKHVLLLFTGREPGDAVIEHVRKLAEQVGSSRNDLVRTCIVAAALTIPVALAGLEDVYLDPNHPLHDRYGARASCLVLLRPDGYIGYRAQPADGEQLNRYFQSIFGA